MGEAAELRARFRARFGAEPRVFRAPGRVNLIGEHTDYNAGFVLPVAIDRTARVAAAPRADRRLVVLSDALDEEASLDLDEADPAPRGDWSDYPHGVALELRRAGVALPGTSLLVESEVPLGAGLSSSAALEVAVGAALGACAGVSLDRLALALACQRAESGFVGTRCGVMDQFAACFGRAGAALRLDCRSLAWEAIPLPPDLALVVVNSMVKHRLASGEYNRRREECDAALRILRERVAAEALRDVSRRDLEALRDRLPDTLYRRCRHVVTENERVLDFCAALAAGDRARLGALMAASHASLRDDYEVSCAELDCLVELACGAPGTVGARMTGGGFGGCTINLVEAGAVEEFRAQLARGYRARAGILPDVALCRAADGVSED